MGIPVLLEVMRRYYKYPFLHPLLVWICGVQCQEFGDFRVKAVGCSVFWIGLRASRA